ncbi:MAG: preprotein translocase subunit SecE [Candidatus Obscuribacterales bacterium]|nr:preprotein translocase subunit SecE [Steroidobacteraceae bacterium]
MTEQVQESATPIDTAKLVGALAIVVAGLAGFYLLSTWPIWARWLVVLAGLGLGSVVGLQSYQGKTFWQFVQSSRVELRKVVWRDRDAPSTLQVTAVVFVVVLILTLFFWGLDAVLGALVRMLTGRGN